MIYVLGRQGDRKRERQKGEREKEKETVRVQTAGTARDVPGQSQKPGTLCRWEVLKCLSHHIKLPTRKSKEQDQHCHMICAFPKRCGISMLCHNSGPKIECSSKSHFMSCINIFCFGLVTVFPWKTLKCGLNTL